jgi:hypothetical protein
VGGDSSDESPFCLNGNIDDALNYPFALTSAEIADMYDFSGASGPNYRTRRNRGTSPIVLL